MEIEPLRTKLFKSDGDFVILYESIQDVNCSFIELLSLKRKTSKIQLINTVLSKLNIQNKKHGKILIERLVDIIYNDIEECHKTIYT